MEIHHIFTPGRNIWHELWQKDPDFARCIDRGIPSPPQHDSQASCQSLLHVSIGLLSKLCRCVCGLRKFDLERCLVAATSVCLTCERPTHSLSLRFGNSPIVPSV